ncbi:MAG TPA: RHS repeat-associated core domain-containing protein [Gammaproteobacteria bacterium]|nr:RHS repeat-associated core domain-containing protein [Gammaproteobacteria bacterium]
MAIRTVRDDGILTTRYVTGNHLGGVSVISDEVGTVDQRMSYGAFGERRDPTTWQPYASMPDLTNITDKGYTGQQQLDAVGLVHMNGRVYDPQIGRFMSADPTVPDLLDGQSFARYAYVENNPLSAIDPSGFEPDHYMWDVVTSRWDCYTGNYNPCSAPGPKLAPTKIAADYGNGTMPSPVGTGQTPVPPAPTVPPAPPPPPQQQQQGQSQNPCATNPTGACYGDTGPFATDSCDVINCGGDNQVLNIINSTDGFTTWDGSIFNAGPGINAIRPRELIEIPNAHMPIGGGSTVGAPKVPGSVGMTIPGGLSIGADAANAIKYGTQVYGPPLAPANTVQTIARTAGIIGRALSGGAAILGAVKLYLDFYNPHSTNTTLALDTSDLAVNVAALKSRNEWIIVGAALYDFARIIQENAPPACEGACAINNEIGYGASLPVIQQDLQQGVPVPGYPGP